MSRLLKEIKHSEPKAVSALEEAGIRTDSEIQSLTREDLRDLFPEPKNFKLRKTVFEIIHKQRPINLLLRDLKDFIPHDSLRDALNSNGVLVDYLHILKEMKTQTENVQNFLEAHIGLLEEFTRNQQQEPDKGSLAGTSTSGSSGSVVSPVGQPEYRPKGAEGPGQMMPYTGQRSQQRAQDFPCVSKVMYQKVVTGKTFNADVQFMDKVKAQDPDQVQLIESGQDSKIIIVFCTISSRVGSDVEAAMFDVKMSIGDIPVILVLMHHTREAKNIFPPRTSGYPQVKLQVNVFFHETTGLLKCHQNNEAASQIKKKLLEYCIQGRKEANGNALGGGDGGAFASASHGPGGGSGSYQKVSESTSNTNYILQFLTGKR